MSPNVSISATQPSLASPSNLHPLRDEMPARKDPGSANYLLGILRTLWTRLRQVRVRQIKKRLRVCETVPLGEKRFIAVIQVDDKQFLLGGSSNSVSLLAQLDKPAEFSTVLQSRIAGVNA
jgi:Flagellar biosynthesis protein, FliO